MKYFNDDSFYLIKSFILNPIWIFPVYLIFIINNSIAQVYHPFPESEVVWQVEHRDSGTPCGSSEIYFYYLNGDTILQGLSYKKLFRKDEVL